MMKKKIRDKTLEIMREEQIKENKEELEKYTYIPKICNHPKRVFCASSNGNSRAAAEIWYNYDHEIR